MTTNKERAVNIIAGAGNCDFCEMFDDPGGSCAYCIRSAETFAQALADAGLLMPDLPKPPQVRDEVELGSGFYAKRMVNGVWLIDDCDGDGGKSLFIPSKIYQRTAELMLALHYDHAEQGQA